MKHLKKGKILGRRSESRQALWRSLAVSLILAEKIKTTEAKARALRPFLEKMVTLGKNNDLNVRRRLLSYLHHQPAVKKILETIGPRYKDRPGGYTRIVKLGQRKGDAAKMAIVEFIN